MQAGQDGELFAADDAAHARRVCAVCRVRKRRCDKALPRCSSCVRKNVVCTYAPPAARPSPQAPTSRASSSPSSPSSRSLGLAWHDAALEVEQPDGHLLHYSAVRFLDPSILQHGQMNVARPDSAVPPSVLQLLGGVHDVLANATRFFATIHPWMAFVSKKRLQHHLHLRSPSKLQPDVVLLNLAIKLITTIPHDLARSPHSPLYRAVKHFHLDVESSGISSLPLLQAGVLLSLYELGHGLYPAAFLSIGAGARLASAMGIDTDPARSPTKALTLVELEERRRTWWAIVILDRFVSIGCPGRRLATSDPGVHHVLPADDADWDEGIVRPEQRSTSESPRDTQMSKFSLLCQASRLLGQVLTLASSPAPVCEDAWMQLERTLQSMLAASLDAPCPDDDQIAFVYSALLALYADYLPPNTAEERNTSRTKAAWLGLQQITNRISENLMERGCFLGRNPDAIPPWGLFFAYRVCIAHMRSSTQDPTALSVVRTLRETLNQLDVRWRAAGLYSQLLEAHEVLVHS